MDVFQANIVRYNEETLKKIRNSTYVHPESVRSQLLGYFWETHSDSMQKLGPALSSNTATKDLEMPMPPLALAAVQQHNIR